MTTDDPSLARVADDRRPPVVLVHAFPLDGRMWEAQRRGLGALTRVLVPDLPGFGASTGHRVRPDLDCWADDLERRLALSLGRGPVVLCGLSMGGYVALRLADRHPHRVAALVLADTRARADDATGRQARDRAIAAVRRDGVVGLVDDLVPRLVSGVASPAVRDRVRRLALDQSPEAVIAALEAMRDRPDSTPVLERLRVPVVVIVGEHDQLTPPPEAATTAAAAGDGTLHVIAGAGHLSSLERPDEFTAVVAGLLDRLAPLASFS
jgi:pimeloyl-ACP methyl ester carboxylesterase